MNIIKIVLLLFLLAAMQAHADNSTLDAAIGGGLGGAAGAAIGNELGGRQGAIVGGSVGAAIGTAVNTDHHYNNRRLANPPMQPQYGYGYPPMYRNSHPGYHCPPGQAKKGRC